MTRQDIPQGSSGPRYDAPPTRLLGAVPGTIGKPHGARKALPRGGTSWAAPLGRWDPRERSVIRFPAQQDARPTGSGLWREPLSRFRQRATRAERATLLV